MLFCCVWRQKAEEDDTFVNFMEKKIRRKKDPFGKLPKRHTLTAFGHITNYPVRKKK